MQVNGAHVLLDPFVGHGVLVIDGRATESLRGRSVSMLIGLVNSMSTGVVASLDQGKLVLQSANDFTIGGNQDVLDVIGIVATEVAPA